MKDVRGPRYPKATATRVYAGYSSPPLTSEQAGHLTTLCVECGADPIKLAKTFGVETLADLPAAKFEQAIERIDNYRARRAGGGPSPEEIDRALEQQYPFLRRSRHHIRAGMDRDEALDLALAEELAKGRPWPSQLLKWVAESFLEKCEPKLKAQHWKQVEEPALERAMIDELTKRLKAKGVRAYRGEAEELYAQKQNVTVHALRKRQQRRRKY